MSGRSAWSDAVLRPGRERVADVKLDVWWLLGFGLLLIATGIGLRDPWPADEPRFTLIARDILATGDWLLPHVGGDIYADKPPLYFWLMALGIELTGSLRVAFLLPSLLSGIACALLVYDLGRRLWNRETGLIAGLALLFTVQFVWQARQAQIDATLCFWTTLGLYGLLRHLLLGPAWRWYCVGWAAAGFGVITKGVGFLPLLVLIPYVILRSSEWRPRLAAPSTARWLLGPLAFAAATAVWLAPMLIAAMSDPTLAAYRDEILFRQTIERYADAWHHREPFWYFVLEVIPWLWLPLTALLPWVVPAWRRAWREHDLRIALLTTWTVLVVLFFSVSSGKRGVYVLPAVPAFVLACAPYLREIALRPIAQRVAFGIAATVAAVTALAIPYVLLNPSRRAELVTGYGLDPLGPLIVLAAGLALVCALARPRRGFAAFAGAVVCALLVVSFWINPTMNDARSGKAFIERVERVANPHAPLGFVAFKEQYLLQARRSIVHFGHARWRESKQETMDAARWLAESADHQLVVNEESLQRCFTEAHRKPLGWANRTHWYLVSGEVAPDCVRRGQPNVSHFYNPPRRRAVENDRITSRLHTNRQHQ